MSKITDLIALDQRLGSKKSDGMCIGGNQAFAITHTINFKTMTTINTYYSNTELLDQELNLEELVEVSGGDYYPGQRTNGWTEFWIKVFGFDKK